MNLTMQCPGCWSVSHNDPEKDWECECGEKLTVIDLRDKGDGGAPLTADRGELDCCYPVLKLDESEPERLNISGRIFVPEEAVSAGGEEGDEERASFSCRVGEDYQSDGEGR